MRGLAFLAIVSAFAVRASPLEASHDAVKPPILDYVTFSVDVSGAMSFNKHQNGLYMSYNNTHFSYHGNELKNTKTLKGDVSRSLDARQQSCDVSCYGQFGTASDISAAINNLKNVFGGGFSYHGTIVEVAGNAFAFGCDYGNGQQYNSGQYSFDVACFQSQCGPTQGAANHHNHWKATYGVRVGTFSC